MRALLRLLKPDVVLPVLVGGVTLGAVAVLLGLAVSTLRLQHTSAEYEARCLGWCEAHGYNHAFYTGSAKERFGPDVCLCAAPVGADAALVDMTLDPAVDPAASTETP